MKLWNFQAVWRTLFPTPVNGEVIAVTRRWRDAFRADPDLRADLIRLGGLLALTAPTPDLSAAQLAYEAGRRDLALALLSLGEMSPYHLNQMMEHSDD